MLENNSAKTQEINFAQVQIKDKTGARSLVCKSFFNTNDEICTFSFNNVLKEPNYLTIQIGENKHIELIPSFLECTNHSCSPNCFFDTTNHKLIAINNIKDGEEFRFFYPSSEWDMEQEFECNCSSKNCIGTIKGAKYLSESQRKTYRFTEYIKQKFSEISL